MAPAELAGTESYQGTDNAFQVPSSTEAKHQVSLPNQVPQPLEYRAEKEAPGACGGTALAQGCALCSLAAGGRYGFLHNLRDPEKSYLTKSPIQSHPPPKWGLNSLTI